MPGHLPDRAKNKAEFERIKKELNRRLGLFYRAITLEAHKRIVLRTPVDTGRARGNWIIDNIRSEETRDKTDKNGVSAQREARDYTKKLTLEDKTWIVNNLPYVPVLENGGYPNPPKHGSWVKGKGYVVKSSGGYSKQAPHGMVAVTVAELEVLIPKLVDEVRNSVQ